jgi:hypothetical protein
MSIKKAIFILLLIISSYDFFAQTSFIIYGNTLSYNKIDDGDFFHPSSKITPAIQFASKNGKFHEFEILKLDFQNEKKQNTMIRH